MRIGQRLSGFLAFVILLAVAAAAAWEQQPHGHEPESAPAEVFSAGRAFRVVEAIAQRPHPVGTAEHARVRDHLVAQLRDLGLQTEIQTGIGRYPGALARDVVGMGRADNIVARLPGTNSTGTIYLAAHYDSVASSPGANDDGVGVAAVLETVRALRASGTTLRNDVVALLTDAEETGLLGAEAFVTANPDLRGDVIINHEARGAGGPVFMWRSTRPDGALIRAVADTPRPNADSLSTALAGEQTSSNTDFASFETAGPQVLDFAYAGRSAYYHNRLDDPAHVPLATLQQMGDNSLALTRDLGDRDLAAASHDDDPAYFSLPFGVLVVLPIWVIIALALVSVVASGWVLWRVRRAGETSFKRVFGAAALFLVTVPIAMAAVYGHWEGVQAIEPEYRPLFVDPYRPELFYAAVIVLSVAILAAWFALSRRWLGATATAAGVLCCLSVLAALFALAAPAAAQVLVIPVVAAALGVSAGFAVPDRWRLPVLTVFLIPSALFLGSLWAALQTGVAAAAFLAAPTIILLGGLLTLTLTHAWPARRGWAIPATAVVLAAALTAAGLAVDRTDAQHPLTAQLIYAFDADQGQARWLSRSTPDRWTSAFVEDTAPGPRYAALWSDAVTSGPAPTQALPPPIAEILSDTTDSEKRTIRMRLRSQRAATSIALRYTAAPLALRVAGRDVTPLPKKGIQFHAPPAEGLEVELVAPAGPLDLTLVDYNYLPDSGIESYGPEPADVYLRQDSASAVFTTIPAR
ncbi:M20/M25/M40 family metallo-hydrolase [Nocardia sp. NPDC051832]|uniref:M20/M25/M40 family metallo-hydrolase n=1 Tax=Nocardia sp. NPDC051832 TaxID=3155673 RepID=UPI00341E9267